MELSEKKALMKERIVKRKMDTKAGEVRRVHIVYFLSRMGKIEHPHLIRVHHMNRNGVRLRDVKRWLSDLRGKDMPDSFAWSYKRMYKTGYVWQDLLEDDLITPVSDNEYVLKGSEISATPLADHIYSLDDKKSSIEITDPVEDKIQQPSTEKFPENPVHKSDEVSCKPAQIEEGSKPPSQATDWAKKTVTFNLEDQPTPKTESVKEESMEKSIELPPFPLGAVKKKKKNENAKRSSQPFSKSKSHSNGASNVFRNILSCGAVDTNDSVMMMINRSSKPLNNTKKKTETSKMDLSIGTERTFAGAWNQQQQYSSRKSSHGGKQARKTSEFGNQKSVSSVFKPVAEPNCSQCGKTFKPEKLHAHMKSCKGLKMRGKGVASEKASQTAREELTKVTTPAYILTH